VSAWGIAGTLARASVEGGFFVAGVWLLCRLVPRLPAALRCGLWWAACLKLLLGLVPLPAVVLPVLPAVERVASAKPVLVPSVAPPARTLTPGPSPFPSPPPSKGEGNKRGLQEIGTVALMDLWLAGLLMLAWKALGELQVTRRIVRSSEPVREGWVRAAFAGICARLGLRRAPELRGSGEVRTPQVTGLAQPVVLIPRAGIERLTPAEVSMMLCHELVHLRRKDLWLGWVPALAHRIFFFHPLAALAAREYAIAREAACDAEVLRILGSAPRDYGRLLLRWGVAPRETGLAAAGASPSLQTLKRRLQMLQSSEHIGSNNSGRRRVSGWWWLAGAAVLAGLVPLRIVAQQPAPKAPVATPAPDAAEAPEAEAPADPEEATQAPEPPEATPAPEAPKAPPGGGAYGGVPGGIPGGVEGGIVGGVEGGIVGGVSGGVGDEVTPAVAPVAPSVPKTPRPSRTPRAYGGDVPPVPAVPPRPALAPRAAPPASPAPRPALAPMPPLPPTAPRLVAKLAWAPTPAPAPGPTPRAQGAIAQPTPPPAPPAPPAPPRPPKPPAPPKHQHGFAYRTGGDDSYVLMYGGSDSVTMSGDTDDLPRVKRLRGESKEDFLWFRHGGKEYVVHDASLLKQVQEISKAQGELGARQGELGGRQGALGAKQGELGAKQGALGSEQGALASARARRGGDADERDLDKREKELEAKMDDLGRQQEALGKQQEELGRQQEALGRQQEELGRKAEKEMHELMERAVKSGAAQEVK
jgi:beta-lactamase regulating signal transducer with metallopeptidase domain